MNNQVAKRSSLGCPCRLWHTAWRLEETKASWCFVVVSSEIPFQDWVLRFKGLFKRPCSKFLRVMMSWVMWRGFRFRVQINILYNVWVEEFGIDNYNRFFVSYFIVSDVWCFLLYSQKSHKYSSPGPGSQFDAVMAVMVYNLITYGFCHSAHPWLRHDGFSLKFEACVFMIVIMIIWSLCLYMMWFDRLDWLDLTWLDRFMSFLI